MTVFSIFFDLQAEKIEISRGFDGQKEFGPITKENASLQKC